VIAGKANERILKLLTVKTDGTSLTASTFEPKVLLLSWAQPITPDVVPTIPPAPTEAPAESPTEAPTTTPTSTTTTTTTTLPKSVYVDAVPGITVTDPTVYRTAPKEVAGNSAIIVLTPTQNKVMDIVSKTPSVCLPNDDDLVFIDEGKCIAEVVNAKTRKALRTLRTTVVADDISELKVGNEVAVLTPLYFIAGSYEFKPRSLARLAKLKDRITSAGSVLVAGHSGILLGNTPENIKLAGERANAAVKELKARGAKGPFSIASVGALDPETTVKTQAAQEKNRRVVIVLIP
jgi:outer membrane protein OmpA-like peptidoglycan-associated protein